jgi:hypothetical protein
MKQINVVLTEEKSFNLWCVLGEFRRVTRDQAKLTAGSNHSLEMYDIACSLHKKLVESEEI